MALVPYAFDKSTGGRKKKKFVFENVTTAQEYKNFLMSGLNLASTGQIGDANFRTVSEKIRSGGAGKAARKAGKDAARNAVDPVKGQNVVDLGSEGSRLLQYDADQMNLMTTLYEQRLNDIKTRRSRPGFRQVQ